MFSLTPKILSSYNGAFSVLLGRESELENRVYYMASSIRGQDEPSPAL